MDRAHIFSFLRDGHLGYLPFGAVTNNGSIKIGVQIFVQAYVVVSLRYTPRSRIVWSYSNSV